MSRKRPDERRNRRSRSRSYGSSRSGSPDEEDGVRLHVADLGMGVSKRELQHVFDKYGPLREIWVAKSPPCFAFVVFREKDDAEDAVKATDGMTLCGSRIRVTFARPRTRGRGQRGYDPNMRCYQCGERGHFSRDCPDTKYGYKRPPSRSPPPGSRRSHRPHETGNRGYRPSRRR
ncbi:Splicing factor, arginine/serine-rich 7 [Zootermopsis nevadensis]|uniref:Splicing factor, arginine/serine-rich 7 n=1 Tax=Zootermopsis nevadensis TaxID=136037 RepID=A0A067QKD0_ZOONE|nr:Splicing factor, arginine/serine-rich 7 [Zootermopsis nevadensis]